MRLFDQVVALLRMRKRVAYRALKLQFHLDDEPLDTLKEELIEAQELAVDKDSKVLSLFPKGHPIYDGHLEPFSDDDVAS